MKISIFLKEALNKGHNGHIYGVKKQETNDELNQTFPKTSITVHAKQESFDVPVVFIHSQEQILLGKWSLGLMPFGLKSLGLIQLVTWLNFFKLSVSGIGHLA